MSSLRYLCCAKPRQPPALYLPTHPPPVPVPTSLVQQRAGGTPTPATTRCPTERPAGGGLSASARGTFPESCAQREIQAISPAPRGGQRWVRAHTRTLTHTHAHTHARTHTYTYSHSHTLTGTHGVQPDGSRTCRCLSVGAWGGKAVQYHLYCMGGIIVILLGAGEGRAALVHPPSSSSFFSSSALPVRVCALSCAVVLRAGGGSGGPRLLSATGNGRRSHTPQEVCNGSPAPAATARPAAGRPGAGRAGCPGWPDRSSREGRVQPGAGQRRHRRRLVWHKAANPLGGGHRRAPLREKGQSCGIGIAMGRSVYLGKRGEKRLTQTQGCLTNTEEHVLG